MISSCQDLLSAPWSSSTAGWFVLEEAEDRQGSVSDVAGAPKARGEDFSVQQADKKSSLVRKRARTCSVSSLRWANRIGLLLCKVLCFCRLPADSGSTTRRVPCPTLWVLQAAVVLRAAWPRIVGDLDAAMAFGIPFRQSLAPSGDPKKAQFETRKPMPEAPFHESNRDLMCSSRWCLPAVDFLRPSVSRTSVPSLV